MLNCTKLNYKVIHQTTYTFSCDLETCSPLKKPLANQMPRSSIAYLSSHLIWLSPTIPTCNSKDEIWNWYELTIDFINEMEETYEEEEEGKDSGEILLLQEAELYHWLSRALPSNGHHEGWLYGGDISVVCWVLAPNPRIYRYSRIAHQWIRKVSWRILSLGELESNNTEVIDIDMFP